MQGLHDHFKNAICYLTLAKGTTAANGLGGFISPRHVLTAKHVLEGCDYLFATNVYGDREIHKLKNGTLKIHTLPSSDTAILTLQDNLAPAHFTLDAQACETARLREAFVLSDKGSFLGADLKPTDIPKRPGLLKSLFSRHAGPPRAFSAPASPVIRSVDFSHSHYPVMVTEESYVNRKHMTAPEYLIPLSTSFILKPGQSGSVVFDAGGRALSVLSSVNHQNGQHAARQYQEALARSEKAGTEPPDNRVIPFFGTYPRHLRSLAQDVGLLPPTA